MQWYAAAAAAAAAAQSERTVALIEVLLELGDLVPFARHLDRQGLQTQTCGGHWLVVGQFWIHPIDFFREKEMKEENDFYCCACTTPRCGAAQHRRRHSRTMEKKRYLEGPCTRTRLPGRSEHNSPTQRDMIKGCFSSDVYVGVQRGWLAGRTDGGLVRRVRFGSAVNPSVGGDACGLGAACDSRVVG